MAINEKGELAIPDSATAKPLPPTRKPRPRWLRLSFRISLTVVALLVLISAFTLFFARRTLPTIDGTLRVDGLNAPVEILRDRWGVPHIYAQSVQDAFFAQGYVHAQDRLWQMELFRRTGSGTLSEIFGEVTLDTDRFLRTIGMRRVAEQEATQLDDESGQILESYAAGVNAFVETHRDRLPLEFTILGFQPSPWVPADSLTWAKVMAWDLGGNWERELLRAKLVAKFGADALRELAPPYPADSPIIVPPEVSYQAFDALALSDIASLVSPLGATGVDIGSNNWVIDGSKSTTGKPLLANDPHLGIQMPAIWYEVQISAPGQNGEPGLNVAGASLAGVPGVVIGHNDHIAWGVTNTGPDVQDLYVEKLNPSNTHQYLFEGRWEDAEVISEEIKVKGQAEIVHQDVVVTRHGPLLNGVVKGLGQPIAFRWTALQPGETLRAFSLVNRAQNWEQFRAALRYYTVPSQNFVYADTAGNIGYQVPGLIPIRAKGDGLLPVPGWTGEYEWTSFIPFDKLPSTYNPPQHFIATANNRVVDDGYPFLISYDWDPGFRARRITELLHSKDKLGSEDFQRMQSDVLALTDRELAGYLAQLSPEDEPSRRAIAYLRGWDGNLSADSVAGAIVETTFIKLLRNVYADAMGDELFKSYLDAGSGIAWTSLLGLLRNERSGWFTNVRSPAQLSRDEAALKSLREAVDELRQRFGDDPSGWRWGRLHTATFSHPLGKVKPLDRLFNLGPYERTGSGFTLNNTGYATSKSFEEKTVASLREIIDLGDFDRSLFVHTTGQSGQPFSSHFGDFAALWLRGQYHPMLFSRENIEAQREGRLLLTP